MKFLNPAFTCLTIIKTVIAFSLKHKLNLALHVIKHPWHLIHVLWFLIYQKHTKKVLFKHILSRKSSSIFDITMGEGGTGSFFYRGFLFTHIQPKVDLASQKTFSTPIMSENWGLLSCFLEVVTFKAYVWEDGEMTEADVARTEICVRNNAVFQCLLPRLFLFL